MHSLQTGERSRIGSRDSPVVKIAGLAFFALRERELDQIMQGHVCNRSKLFHVYSKLNETQVAVTSLGFKAVAAGLAEFVAVRKIIRRLHHLAAASPLHFKHNL